MNRREFCKSIIAGGVCGLGLSSESSEGDPGNDFIRVIKLGSDELPATEDDIQSLNVYLETHKEVPAVWHDLLVEVSHVNRMPKPGILVVRIGDENRPASKLDLEDAKSLLASDYMKKDLSIVTHHLFNVEWRFDQLVIMAG